MCHAERRICAVSRAALLLAAVFWGTSPSMAQSPAPAANAPLPSDAKSLLLLAGKLNGLSGDDLQPWHMKISFSVFDENGKNPAPGTFEVYWVDTSKYKISFSSAEFTQSAYGTASGVLYTGARDPAPELLREMVKKFINPISLAPEAIQNSTVERQKREIEKSKLVCLTERGHRPEPPHLEFMSQSYCLDTDSVALRAVGMLGAQVPEDIRNDTIQFQGHYLPGDLEIRRGSKLLFKAHIDLVELFKAENVGEIAPPKDARPAPQIVTVTENDARKLLIQNPKPVYPPIAQAARVAGSVVLQITIGTDGRVAAARVISGPPMLQGAALEGVKKWTFKPLVQNGESVQMDATITIPFTLPI
jgi:TonB family protein